jgi:hypothetical protein
MAFCSQCGFLLPPEATACPFCDAPVTPGSGSGAESQNADDPTIITALEKTEHAGNVHDAKTDLVQKPESFAASNSQARGSTQISNTANTPDASPVYHTLPPEYFTPTSTPIPPPPPDYPVRNDGNFSTTQGGSYPGSFSPIGPVGPGVSASPQPFQPQKTKGNAWLIALIVSLLIIVGATATVFVIGPTTVLQILRGGTTPQPTPVPSTVQAITPQVPTPTPMPPTPTPTPTATPQQQAQAVVANYYTAINNKDYQTAYNLWVNYPDTYQNFANGFATTQHDDYQIGQVTQQSDGTVKVNLTLTATSTSSQQATYQGYYSVGQQADGSWKIITASMSQT